MSSYVFATRIAATNDQLTQCFMNNKGRKPPWTKITYRGGGGGGAKIFLMQPQFVFVVLLLISIFTLVTANTFIGIFTWPIPLIAVLLRKMKYFYDLANFYTFGPVIFNIV